MSFSCQDSWVTVGSASQRELTWGQRAGVVILQLPSVTECCSWEASLPGISGLPWTLAEWLPAAGESSFASWQLEAGLVCEGVIDPESLVPEHRQCWPLHCSGPPVSRMNFTASSHHFCKPRLPKDTHTDTHTHTPGSLVQWALVPAATDGPESIIDINYHLPLHTVVNSVPPNSYVQVRTLSTSVNILEIGPLRRWLSWSKALGVGPWSSPYGKKKRHQGWVCTKGWLCEEAARGQLSVS